MACIPKRNLILNTPLIRKLIQYYSEHAEKTLHCDYCPFLSQSCCVTRSLLYGTLSEISNFSFLTQHCIAAPIKRYFHQTCENKSISSFFLLCCKVWQLCQASSIELYQLLKQICPTLPPSPLSTVPLCSFLSCSPPQQLIFNANNG